MYNLTDLFVCFIASDDDFLLLLPADMLDGNFDRITCVNSDLKICCLINVHDTGTATKQGLEIRVFLHGTKVTHYINSWSTIFIFDKFGPLSIYTNENKASPKDTLLYMTLFVV
ncbi:hypothetical protein BK146_21445 [Paenibacillus sp. FSL R7-0333]|nr:hypothetical protein BK146_21445 [Paenibacillus sp. FSL R7-0333]